MKRIADHVADWLVEKEITHVFGIIGAGNLALFDAISKKKEITIVCCHHEQAATMASDYFNRTKGCLKSICLVTTGAGSSNAITGVVAAFMDSTQLMVISGNEPSHFFKMPHPRVVGVQGYPSASLVAPVTKYAEHITNRDYVSILVSLSRGKRIAEKDRMGPVWIDIPRDTQVTEGE